MNKLQRLMAVALMALPVLVACNRDNDNNNNVAPAERTADIQRGRWQLTSLNISTQALGQTIVLETLDSLQACERDDLVRFTGTRMIIEDAGIQCNPTTADTANYAWLDNNSKIRITDTDGDVVSTFNITSYTTSQMMATSADTVLGIPVAGRYTYTRR